MREYVADESVDLVYLDPPFNSNASYNVLFREKSGVRIAVPDKGVHGQLAVDAGGGAHLRR